MNDFQQEEWKPKRSMAECDRIITAPGAMLEMEHVVINGRVLKAYKNLPLNIRAFWLDCAARWQDREYIIYENERYTYGQVRERASTLASLLYTSYSVRKGDRVAIIMRNYPEFIIAFWAIHLLGGVSTMINAWAPPGPLLHCISSTTPRVIIVDPERADSLSRALFAETEQKLSLDKKIFVIRGHTIGTKWRWKGISSLEDTLEAYRGPEESWRAVDDCSPEDNAAILFTSGTTGLPKGVLSSHRGYLTNFFNMIASKMREALRKGEEIPAPDPNDPQKGSLISVPLFHATGLTAMATISTAIGGKIALMHKWDKEEAARIIEREHLTNAGGVPSIAMDLIESSLNSSALESIGCGGAPPADILPRELRRRFKNAVIAQGYGLSEANGAAAMIQGDDYLARPTSTGVALPVTELIIVDITAKKLLPPGEVGEIWIKGPNIMKGYWADKAATEKVITPDGWLRSGDSGYKDEEGFLYIKDRIKDIIIRGGENIHSIEVENALYADDRIMDAAVVSVLDKRLGELVAAVVATKPQYRGGVSEEDVMRVAQKQLPAHAVPVIVLVQDDPIERNANGKIMKDVLRCRVRKEWDLRLKYENKSQEERARFKL